MKTTLCYIEHNGAYLMLLRNKKDNDINANKWIGVGGKFLEGETAEECLAREVLEETGFSLTSWIFHGVIDFFYGEDVHEEMHLFSSSDFLFEEAGIKMQSSSDEWNEKDIPLPNCNEGTLAWIPKNQILDLDLWEGDKTFLAMLIEGKHPINMELYYNHNDELIDIRIHENE